MERYVPGTALAFVEIDSLADVSDGLTGTQAFRELAPVLGLSSQLAQVGIAADLIGRTGLGPDEAVLIGRAQFAIALTGIESSAGQTEEGPYLHLRPQFVLIIESHLAPGVASRLVRERAPVIAQRIYGDAVVQETADYRGSELLVFHRPESERRLLVSSLGSVILLANDERAMSSCLDSVAGRGATLSEDATLRELMPAVNNRAAVTGYLTASGLRKLFEIWPALIAGGRAEPGTVASLTDLLQHISEQAALGLLYALEFKEGGVTERYLAALHPEVGAALAQPLKSAPGADSRVLRLAPRSIERLTLLQVSQPVELPARVLKHLSPNLDLVAGVALREFVINFRKEYGLEPADSLGAAAGDELAVVRFGDGQPAAMLIPVNDKARLMSAALKYVGLNGGTVTNQAVGDVELLLSDDDRRRAAAFVGDCLVLGTSEQIARIAETRAKGEGIDHDPRLKEALSRRPPGASVVTYRPHVEDAGPFLLALSKLTRATDGSRGLLEGERARKATRRLPRTVSFTEFRDYGVYVEAKSAVGSFALIAALLRSDEE